MNKIKKKYRWLVPFPRRKTLLRWFPPFETRNLVHLLGNRKIDTVLDVGANRGQYAGKLRSAGYRGRIISFEPLTEPHDVLQRASARDESWIVHPRSAVGAGSGSVTVNVYGDDSLSSPRTLLSGKKASSALHHTEICPLISIDQVFADYMSGGQRVLMKVDVQGFERDVLQGAENALRDIHGIQIELSLSTMYEGEAGYLEIMNSLNDLGFKPVFFLPVTNRQRLGEMKQIDALLFRD
jgi:FkbM family methyltransferase